MTLRHVVVVGAGVAGLACALACARSGARVEVLEALSGARHVPAHIDLVPSLLRDLARLGVAEACVQRGFAYSGVAVVDEHGDEAFHVPTQRLAGHQLPPAAGIALDELLDVLATAAAQSGATLRRGWTVRAVEADRGRVLGDNGQVFDADMVVLAAGAESPLVTSLFGPVQPGALRHDWWHVLVPRPAWLDRATWMAGSVGRRLFLVPVGIARAGVAVVGAAPREGPADGGALARVLQSWGALPRRVAALIEPSAPTAVRLVTSALREAPWYRGVVLCVGAAAHAVAPPFGQSAAQALEDAVVIGELLRGDHGPAVLLQRYSERRVARARRLHELTERAARWVARPEPATDLLQLAGEIDALVAQPA